MRSVEKGEAGEFAEEICTIIEFPNALVIIVLISMIFIAIMTA